MSENNTQETNESRSFEERVFMRFDAVDARFDAVDARFDAVDARFDTVDARLGSLEGRVEKLELKQYDTKPIWEQALATIAETNIRMEAGFNEFRTALAETNTRMEQGFEQIRTEMKSEFATLRTEIEDSLQGVEYKIDALNQNILQLQANQKYFGRRLHELESQPKST